MAGRLQDQVAIVVGGSRGVGEGVVDVFIREGAMVELADISDEEGAEVVARHGGRARYTHGDTASRADMQALAAATVERHGRIDVLAHVAGIYPAASIEDMTEELWDRVMAVNVKGAFLAIQACFPHMKARRHGRIALTGSITGMHVTWPELAHYSASKAALVGLARAAALEGAAFGITCNVVAPGNVDTKNVRRLFGDAHVTKMASAVPLGRCARPDEIGESMAFLCSEAGSYITGTTLILDGGQILPEAPLG